MATILDIGLLGYFSIIFPFLLIYAVVVGLLGWLKFFGDNKVIHNIIAISLAFLFMLSSALVKVVNMAVPWLILMFILLMFLLIAYKFLGAKDEDIAKVLLRDKTVVIWIMILFIIILLGSVAKVYFTESAVTTAEGEGGITVSEEEIGKTGVSAFWSTLFNPQLLAAIMVLLIAVFAIMLLSSDVRK
jgi:hypothetical protein